MRVVAQDAVEVFTIYDVQRSPGRGMIDPITVVLRDFGDRGQIIVECFGASWSHYFGAYGSKNLRQFLACCDHEYLADKLITSTVRKASRREEAYVTDIARAVIAGVKQLWVAP